ncbi:MAG: glucuronate isomerase [Acidimicrobiales bacterium]
MDATGPDADLLFPTDTRPLSIAREIYGDLASLPIVSAHTHVEAALLERNEPFAGPAELLVTPDHYLLRLLHASGVDLASLGRRERAGERDDSADAVGHTVEPAETGGREIWRVLCRNWPAFRGTNSRLWLEIELARLFGVTDPLAEATADSTYDRIASALAEDDYRPRALYERFGIEVLATTDGALDPLTSHRKLAADPHFVGRVIPTFRPDKVLDATRDDFSSNVAHLGRRHDVDTGGWRGYCEALRMERERFIAQGTVSSDHGPSLPDTIDLSEHEAARLFADVLSSSATEADRRKLSAHLLFKMAELSCDDGLVMQLHAGILRDHDSTAHARFGPDIGADFPVDVSFTRGLRPLLERFGSDPRFTLVVYSVDETAYARELAPMASYYPALRLGAPWWYLDAPDAMTRALSQMAEVAGFSRSAGFVDDARSFCSIPARHEVARRVTAAFLARLVAEHRLSLQEAIDTGVDLAYRLPKSTFGL